jgi:hypothetical protein
MDSHRWMKNLYLRALTVLLPKVCDPTAAANPIFYFSAFVLKKIHI